MWARLQIGMPLLPPIRIEQLVRSETAAQRGIDNSPPPELQENLRRLAQGLEQVQALLGHPIEISSGYRSAELNAAVGGTAASQHLKGLAADFACPAFGPPMEIALAVARSAIAYDQCILEFDEWIHISFTGEPRGRVLTIREGTRGYLAGLWDREGNRLA